MGSIGLVLLSLCIMLLHWLMNDHEPEFLSLLSEYGIRNNHYYLFTSFPFFLLSIMFLNYYRAHRCKSLRMINMIAFMVMSINWLYYLIVGLQSTLLFSIFGMWFSDFLVNDAPTLLNIILIIVLIAIVLLFLIFYKCSLIATLIGLLALASYIYTFSDFIFKIVHDLSEYPEFAITRSFTLSNILFALMIQFSSEKIE
ncbi:hypothetical protein HLPCO_001878 [Haloplasma contractile SSD-17B]|uniref:Uncharacterized protein n=2 Tax=Haloplasma TaxID=471824 RepID=U2FL86_9MOLU|nr:hypothetical protein HLPCO_001878 [Haloplasma contractile SSD-17B]